MKVIAVLLEKDSRLKLYVVGHTDDQGSLSNNMTLSNARAATVKTLVTKYKINNRRLSSFGVWPYAPVSTNSTDAGKEKNRRVELVKRLK